MTSQKNYKNFSLGRWKVSAGTCVLSDGDFSVKVTPKSMDVLIYLAKNPGRVVNSKELLDSLWDVTTSDHAVHKVVAELRHALGDDARNQRYIKTIPRRGYSLLLDPVWAKSQYWGKRGDDGPPEAAAVSPRLSWKHWLGFTAVLSVLTLLAYAPTKINPPTRGDVTTSVGVLSFEGDAETMSNSQFLIDGLNASLLHGLSKLSQLGVVSVPDDEQHSINQHSTQEVGVALGVDHLLEGMLIQDKGQIRLIVHLFRTTDGLQIYSAQFDVPAHDVFAVQDKIVSDIVTALSIHLDDEQRSDMLDWGTTNALAYEQFMMGEFYNNQFNPPDFERAIEHHQAAIKLDPKFINAYLGVATAANNLAVYSTMKKIQKLQILVGQMHRAVASIDGDSEALDSIRAIELRMSGSNYREEETILRQQIMSGSPPDFAMAHYALFLIGARLFDEAALFIERTSEVNRFDISPDEIWSYRVNIETPENQVRMHKQQLQERPHHVGILGMVARNLALMGKFEEAAAYVQRQQIIDPEGISSHHTKVVIGALTGQLHEDSREVRQSYAMGPDFDYDNGVLALMLGDIETGGKFWRRLRPVQKRKLVNRAYASEKFFPADVLDNAQYQALLEELGIGISWQRTLMEGVMEMEVMTGVKLSEAARNAYQAHEFINRNNRWTEDQWQTLEQHKHETKNLNNSVLTVSKLEQVQ